MPSVKELEVILERIFHRIKIKYREIERGKLLIKCGGKEYEVDISEYDPKSESSSVIKVDGKPYDVLLTELDKDGKKQFKVTVDQEIYNAHIPKKRPTAKKSQTYQEVSIPTVAKPARQITKSGGVKANMPGKVVMVKVKPGDSVKEGDMLLVVEAMKMENEIAATKAGIVKEVKVSEGSSVDRGDTLVVIE